MALSVTNKLSTSTLDPQLVKILQDLENKIPDSHFTLYTTILSDNKGMAMFAIGDAYTSPAYLKFRKPVIGMILCNELLVTEWSTVYNLSLLLGDHLPDLGGYIYFCGNGWIEEMFNVTSNGDAVATTLTILHSQSQKIQFSIALLLGTTTL